MLEHNDAHRTIAFDRTTQRRLFAALSATVIAHAVELTDLDRAIGDGDHGINLTRGFKAVALQIDELSAMPIGPALKEIGKRLVMSVGGASGPLYGTFFIALGDRLTALTDRHSEAESISRADVVHACEAAVAAVQARGKSTIGQKTMLDVLVPVQEVFRAGGDDICARLIERAEAAAAATIPLLAQRGRASFLGERSVGHMDPGARSSQLLIAAACTVLQPPAQEKL